MSSRRKSKKLALRRMTGDDMSMIFGIGMVALQMFKIFATNVVEAEDQQTDKKKIDNTETVEAEIISSKIKDK